MSGEKDDYRAGVLKFIVEKIEKIHALLDLMGQTITYRGRLSPRQVADGMNAARRNARRLLNDAEILFREKRFPSAAALAVLAIEEAGKTPILRMLATARNAEEIKRAWKSYRSHQTKNVLWLFPLYVLTGVRTLSGFGSLFDPKSKHTKRLDELKQWAVYTDCLNKGEWSEPENFVDELIAEFILKTARALTEEKEVTEQEIELWIEHVGPQVKHAGPRKLKRFWDAMIAENLATVTTPELESFLGLDRDN
jgi:AbiV family abortive infection protein